MSDHTINDIAALEAAIGPTPPAAALKVIPYLDRGACDWIGRSPLFFAAFADDRTVAVTAGAGIVGGTADGRELHIARAALDHSKQVASGSAFASLFLLPGIGETLRVNGTIVGADDETLRVSVSECYGHCAKALIRSDFWQTPASIEAPDDASFLDAVRFIVLATASTTLHADLSPKGDPAGLMVQRDGDTLLFADRPGNRRLDSFRNIVERRQAAIAMLVPGSTRVAIATGAPELTTDASLRSRFDVAGKTPGVAVRVTIEKLEFSTSAALTRAALWPVQPVTAIDPAKLFVEHVRRNRTEGAAAALARASLAVPGAASLLRRGLERDYKDNLY